MVHRRIFAAASAVAAIAACGEGEPDISEQPIEPTVEPAAPGAETAPLTPPSAPVYVGVWSIDSELCGVAAASAVPGPIAITESEFLGYENRCSIAHAQEGTEGGYKLTLSCRSEGVEYQETIDVDVDGEMLRLRREDAPETAFVRCPDEDGEQR